MWKVMPHVLGDAHAFPNKVFAPYCRAHSKVNGFHACIITNCYKKRVAVRQERIRMYKCWEYTYPRRWPCYIWNTEELIDFLQQNHLLASNMVCSNCGTAMVPRQKSDTSESNWDFSYIIFWRTTGVHCTVYSQHCNLMP